MTADYREGGGSGVRYSAFDRYTRMAQQSLQRIEQAQRGLTDFRPNSNCLIPPSSSCAASARHDAIPWADAEDALHAASSERPAVPAYAEFVNRTASGQEDLLVAFQELVTAPTGGHVCSLLLAAFIDIAAFLLAYASGPHLLGSPEQRWISAGAAVDALDDQVFVRNFLTKVSPGLRGMARVEAAALSAGKRQLCLEDGRLVYLLDPGIHEHLVESLSAPGLPLRASAPQRRRSVPYANLVHVCRITRREPKRARPSATWCSKNAGIGALLRWN